MDNSKYLFLITGAAGSGKSTLARKIRDNANGLIEPIAEICEADEFWYIRGNGQYAFDPRLLWKAHKWCCDKATMVMNKGQNLIVSNTNVKRADRKVYFHLSDEHGYKVVFIHMKTQFQNIHGVPEAAVRGMRDNYAPPSEWEIERIVKWDNMTDDLKELLKKVEVDYEY